MKERVFLARWFLLVAIALPLNMLAIFFVDITTLRLIALFLASIIFGSLIVFYRKDLMEFMQDWYSLVRGRKPKRRDRDGE